MPRIIVLALLFCVGVPAIVGAAPIRIAYKGRFVDLERRFEPNAPFYCDVHGEFVIDETLPEQQMVISASMVIPDKAMSLLASAPWPSITIEDNVWGDANAYPDGKRDQIWFGALFAGWGGVVYEEYGGSGIETSDPSRDPDVASFEFDRGYGIMLWLIGPSSWFDPVANPITRLQGLATYDRIKGMIDYRDWRWSNEPAWVTLEVTSIKVVPEPAAMALISTSIVVGLSLLSRNARTRKVRP